jgi:hypothetical protein
MTVAVERGVGVQVGGNGDGVTGAGVSVFAGVAGATQAVSSRIKPRLSKTIVFCISPSLQTPHYIHYIHACKGKLEILSTSFSYQFLSNLLMIPILGIKIRGNVLYKY